MRLQRLLEQNPNSNVAAATLQLVQELKVPVTAATVIEQVESHPDFPSLYSISDSLNSWKVENAAYQIAPEQLEEVPTPFIAHVTKGGGNFVVVESVNGTVDYRDERGKKVKAQREEFLKLWNNTVLLAEKSAASGEKDYGARKKAQKIQNGRIPLLIGTAAALALMYTLYTIWRGEAVWPALLAWIKLAGTIVSSLLLWFEVDKNNAALKEICSGGKNTNCNAVLSSSAAKLAGTVSWSEVGFVYFTGGFLALLVGSTFSTLALFNLVALPYTLFSVYYQWRVARQWCPLCLAVQALLLLEAVVFYFGHWSQSTAVFPLDFSTAVPVLTAFAVPALFWITAKKIYLQAQSAKRLKKEVTGFKYNKEIFQSLLQQQKGVVGSTDGLGIILGNPEASTTIIKVCNPYCGPCARAHEILEELVAQGDVQLQLLFMATDSEGDRRAPVVKHFMALNEVLPANEVHEALHEWYSAPVKDFEALEAKYPVTVTEKQTEQLKAMEAWCDGNEITHTPTLFVNGNRLPAVYSVADLKHLL